MERHCESALTIAGWLRSQSWVHRVYYPGLPDNPQRELAEREFSGRFGGMLAFDLRAGRCAVVRDPWGNCHVVLDQSKVDRPAI